ncbi:MAG: UDP-N-acetylmuramate--L-alanine ligase [Lachnospirales bacterium]
MRNIKKIYFYGIGGVSMAGFAELLKSKGIDVSGYDSKESSITKKLVSLGIEVVYKVSDINLDKVELVVYSSAIGENSLEMQKLKETDIKSISRGEFIGEILKDYEKPICISGTHGKTTTTALVSTIFLEADKNPTISVGGHLPIINGVFKIGGHEYFILEACEYKNNFLNFKGTTSLIMNVEMDHSDFFKDVKEIRKSFNDFAKLSKEKVIINKEIDGIDEILDGVTNEIITYSLKDIDATYYIGDVENKDNLVLFKLFKRGEFLGDFESTLLGNHNLYNILSALSVSLENGVSVEKCKSGLMKFSGINRRFQYKGEKNGVVVYDDYAHHPTACVEILKSIKKLTNSKVYAVFQPHTFSRTISLFDDFSKAFYDASEIILVDIFPARETDEGIINSEKLVEEINKNSYNSKYEESFESCLSYLEKKVERGDIILTIGAGDVYKIGESFLS